MTKENKTKKNETKEKKEVKKVLGGSSYKNSKQKKKIQKQKDVETKKLVLKDRSLKVKIKHLEKELERIAKSEGDKKSNAEKLVLEKKIAKLGKTKDAYIKKK